mmetsp:Transcript_4138/g.3450  ORF Transcript_4138/g.3450 Transcript_4138/m.3450 type:complete len:118 (+) Transcript_4138:47-400(+)
MPRKSKKAKEEQEQEPEATAAAVVPEVAASDKKKKKARERANDIKLEPDSLEQRRRELQRTIQKTVRKMREEGVDEALIKVEINRIKNREQRTLMHASTTRLAHQLGPPRIDFERHH